MNPTGANTIISEVMPGADGVTHVFQAVHVFVTIQPLVLIVKGTQDRDGKQTLQTETYHAPTPRDAARLAWQHGDAWAASVKPPERTDTTKE